MRAISGMAGSSSKTLDARSTNMSTFYSESMVLPLWRSNYSLNLMLPKEDRKAMLLRLYNDDTPLMDHSKDRFNKAPNSCSDPVGPDGISDGEAEEIAEREAEERPGIATVQDETHPQSNDDDDSDGGVAIGTAGMTADPTGLGSGEGSKALSEQYGSSTGMDNVRE